MRPLFLICFLCSFFSLEAQKGSIFSAPLGMQSYTYRKQMPKEVEKTLDLMSSLGIKELEGGIPAGYTAETFLEALSKRGISLKSTGASFDDLQNKPELVLNRCKELGLKYVMCSWIPHTRGSFEMKDAAKAVEVFNKAGKMLSEAGITLCYHAHGYEFKPYGKLKLMDYIIQNTDKNYVSFEMDVFWLMHGAGPKTPEIYLKRYTNRWKLMHVKDMRIGAVGDGTGSAPAADNVPVGQGQANWPKIFKLARKAGIEHYFIEDETGLELETVPKSIAYLNGLR
jgi:sugar phosphate isomerase/epimerase